MQILVLAQLHNGLTEHIVEGAVRSSRFPVSKAVLWRLRACKMTGSVEKT
jgi:hypothetical protein